MRFTQKSNIPIAIANVNQDIADAIKEIGEGIVTDIRTEMDRDKTGVHYPNLPHRSSAPGESPRTQSGGVAASYQFTPISKTSGMVGSDSPLAKRLENGDVTLAPRPVFHKTVESWRKLALEKYSITIRIGVESARIN